jgi:hypothetical protein
VHGDLRRVVRPRSGYGRRVSFRWRYLTASGTEQAGPDETFAAQAEAESWLSDEWPTLLEGGINAVTLLDTDSDPPAEVYGPMSLHGE